MNVKSPLTGVLNRVYEPGFCGRRRATAAKLHDPTDLWIEAQVAESDIRLVSVGQTVLIELDAHPFEQFSGTVEAIGRVTTGQMSGPQTVMRTSRHSASQWILRCPMLAARSGLACAPPSILLCAKPHLSMDLARLGWRPILTIATFAMLIQQAFSYVCQLVMPILADRIAEDFGISRGWLGLYLFIQNSFAILAAMGCADPALRPTCIADGAVVDGHQHFPDFDRLHLAVSGERRPARNGGRIDAGSSQIWRVCPPRLAPFSVKQTGVPVASLIGGLMIRSCWGPSSTAQPLAQPSGLAPMAQHL